MKALIIEEQDLSAGFRVFRLVRYGDFPFYEPNRNIAQSPDPRAVDAAARLLADGGFVARRSDMVHDSIDCSVRTTR